MDGLLPARVAMLTLLKADADATMLVPSAQIYPQSPPANPSWPFIRAGSPSSIPITATCVDGAEVSVAIHGFSKPLMDGDQIIESAEDRASKIGAAIKQALNKKRIDIAGRVLRIRWVGSQLLPDGAEADAYHTIQNFRVRVLA